MTYIINTTLVEYVIDILRKSRFILIGVLEFRLFIWRCLFIRNIIKISVLPPFYLCTPERSMFNPQISIALWRSSSVGMFRCPMQMRDAGRRQPQARLEHLGTAFQHWHWHWTLILLNYLVHLWHCQSIWSRCAHTKPHLIVAVGNHHGLQILWLHMVHPRRHDYNRSS